MIWLQMVLCLMCDRLAVLFDPLPKLDNKR
jgi:hypothetical protein